MALGVDAVVVRTPFEDFTVGVRRGAARPVGEQLELARWAASQFRFGLDMSDPGVVRAARELLRLLDGGGFGVGFGFDRSGPSDPFAPFGNSFGGIARRLEDELLAGRLVVERERIASLTERRDPFEPELPPLPPPRRESTTHSFEVRFVDEIGKAISGIDAEFTADGAQTRATNAAGIALLEGVQTSSAKVALLDPDALSKVLDPRWETFRPGKPPKESNTTEVVFQGAELGPFDLKAELPNTVVIKPPLGKLFVELWDKTGRVRHANRTYQITGPQSFEGTTDAAGRLLHEEVFQGNYRLSVAIEAFEDDDPDHTVDIVDATVIVLAPDTAVPQVRMLGAVPRVVLGRLNMFFNTNKCFLLPTALPAVEKLRRLYIENAPCKLLCVGHADTRGTRDYNDRLSLERAEATVAYLRDDVEGWFKFYGTGVDTKKRWGKTEDHLMLISLPDFASKPLGEDPVRWFQRTRDLDVDGVAGSDTRHALIAEYMSLDGTSLEDFVGEIDATPHGCGENFPLDDEGDELDSAPADNKRDPFDRRLELFFFDSEYGITPRPPGSNSGPGSIEYPLWRKRATDVVELNADNAGPRLAFVEFADAHFRTDSAVVLPNGTPADDTHEAGITTPGLVANVLRFNEDHGGLTLVVTGHTDTTADAGHNDKLSRERASAALALLEGNRDEFASLANGRHKPADINQILTWISDDLSELGIDCKPASIEGSVDASKVRTFQSGYNINKATLNSASADLAVDGSVGLQTWGAFFDCYEFALRRSLGEDAQGVDDLRGKLLFVDPGRKALGFGERFPIEELGVDNFRSQTNRRVEVLFFEPGEAPDLADSEDDPDTSVLYLPGHFARVPVAAAPDATRGPNIELRVIVDSEAPYTDSDQLVVSNAAGQVLLQVTLGTGQAEANARRFSFVELVKGDRYRAVVKVSPQDFVLFDQTLSNSPPVLL